MIHEIVTQQSLKVLGDKSVVQSQLEVDGAQHSLETRACN